MKSVKWKNWFILIAILCALLGVSSGILIEITGNDADNSEKSTNWKKGFFRLTLVSSILFGTLAGIFFPRTVTEDDDLPASFQKPWIAFLGFFTFIFGFVWLVYFIIQWPIYFIADFVIKGFMS